MTTIIDASVALKWVLPEPGSAEARALRGPDLAASSILLAESANALWRHVVAGRVDRGEAERALQQLHGFVRFIPVEVDATSAFALGVRLRHPIYDCLYLAAAMREGTYLVTADARFVAAVRRHDDLKAHIRLLGEI